VAKSASGLPKWGEKVPAHRPSGTEWGWYPSGSYEASMNQLFSSGTPEDQDSIMALQQYLYDRQYPPPVVERRYGNIGKVESGDHIPSWTVSGYDFPISSRPQGAATVPHEIAHLIQLDRSNPWAHASRAWEDQAEAYRETGSIKNQYTMPGTVEYDASYGLGLAVQDTLSKMIGEERAKRLAPSFLEEIQKMLSNSNASQKMFAR
jgi:hypothetical protein